MRPELPDYGVFLRWPAAGTAWIHAEDRALVARWIPGNHVFRRESYDGLQFSTDQESDHRTDEQKDGAADGDRDRDR